MKNKLSRIYLVIGLIFLGLQMISIVYTRFIPERFFCWAPYDQHSSYKIEVTIDDKSLTRQEVRKRYRYYAEGWEQRSIYNIINLVRQYETTYGKEDNAEVRISYTINGYREGVWEF